MKWSAEQPSLECTELFFSGMLENLSDFRHTGKLRFPSILEIRLTL